MHRSLRILVASLGILFASSSVAPAAARADFFDAPRPAPGGGFQICAGNGVLCLLAPMIEQPPGGGVSVRGAPTLVISPAGEPPIAIRLGEAEVTVTPTGFRFMGSAGFDGFGPLTGLQFTGPHGDLAVGLGSSPAFDGYETNGSGDTPPGFPVGDTRIRKDDRFVYV